MNIRNFSSQFVLATIIIIANIVTVHATSLDHLKDGQLAFNQGQFDKAFEIWHAQALNGDADAQMFVGLSYRNGWGVPKDIDEAIIWYKSAAGQGNAAAQFLLGLSLLNSEDKDEVKIGIEWLHKSAKNGDAEAYQFLKKAKQKEWFRVSDDLRAPVPKTTPEKQNSSPRNNSVSVSASKSSTTNPADGVVLN